MDASSILEIPSMGKAAKVAQACDRCRQKKNKCDGNTPSCSYCVERGEECVYRGYQRRRGPGRSKQHIRALEQRLSDLETLLRRPYRSPQSEASVFHQSPQHEARVVEAIPPAFGSAPATEGESPWTERRGQDTDALEARVENLGIIEEAHKRLPLFKAVTDNLAGDYNSPAVVESLKRIPGLHVPVRKPETILVENTIQEICNDLPLFDIPSFIVWIRQPETLERQDEPSKWVCLNATVALTILFKTLNPSYQRVAKIAWAYLKNAYEALPEMMLRTGDMWGVQAALVMAVFTLRASSDSRAAAMFVSVATRAMQTGFFQSTAPDMVPGMRSRVFWTAYVLDTEISLNSGIPPLLHDEDIDVPLPSQDFRRGGTEVALPSDSLETIVFVLRAELATIQARIRKQLYAAKAFHLSDDELVETVDELSSALDTWRSSVPTDIQPGRHGQVSDSMLKTTVIILHLSYYSSVSMVHWAVRRHSKWETWEAPRLHQERIAASAIRVKTATKVVVQLLPRLKSKLVTDVWRMLPYLLAPGITFLTLILEDPTQVQARLNLQMIERLVQALEALVNDEDLDLGGVLKGCTAMQRVGTQAVSGDTHQEMPKALREIHTLLGGMTHPMFVAQALLGNMPNRDTEVARSLSAALSMPWEAEARFSPWVPTGMQPETYGFKYDLA